MSFFEIINTSLDFVAPFAFGGVLVFLVLRYAIKQCRKDFWEGSYLGLLAFFEAVLAFFVIYLFPLGFTLFIHHPEYEIPIRWIVLYITLPPLWWLLTKKRNGFRGLFSSLIFLTVFLFGWFFERWIGILFISLPILGDRKSVV